MMASNVKTLQLLSKVNKICGEVSKAHKHIAVEIRNS